MTYKTIPAIYQVKNTNFYSFMISRADVREQYLQDEMHIDTNEDNGAALEPGSTGHIAGIMEAGTAAGRTMFSRVAYISQKKSL